MQIFIKNLTRKTLTYDVHLTDTILSLKRQVREIERMPLGLIILSFSGKCLENDRTFLDYEMEKESTIQLLCRMGGGSYCVGCIFPALTCLSAHVSLQCDENISFDDKQLLHSIKTRLLSLNNGVTEAIINCIETCGYEWNALENDDADYFQDHAQRRQSQAINTFIGAICKMINPYLEKYRTSKMLESMKHSIDYKPANESILTKPIDIDWLTFLHGTRCPICFCRFNNVQPVTNAPNRYRTDDFRHF
jgi:hypothetical protein